MSERVKSQEARLHIQLLDVVAVSRASAPSPSTRQTSPVCESQTEARYRAAKSCPDPLQVQPHIYPSTPQLHRSQRTTHVGFYSCTAAAVCRSPRPRDGRRSSSTPLPYMPSKSRLAARFSFLSHAIKINRSVSHAFQTKITLADMCEPWCEHAENGDPVRGEGE